jgi:gliding motility-associated-like protein
MPLPILAVTNMPVTVCRGTPTTVTASGAGPGGMYVWTPPYFIACDTCATQTFTDTFNLVYQLTGYTAFGCKDSITVPVSVLDTNVNVFGNDTIICIGGSAQLYAFSHSLTSNLDVPTYLWSPAGTLNNPFITNPVATPNVTTTYTVVVTENACFSKTAYIKVTVDPLPALNILQHPGGNPIVAGTLDTLCAVIGNDVSIGQYIWTPAAGLNCDTCACVVAVPTVNTTYTLNVISNHGCPASDTVRVNITCDQSQVFIPNTFTPNGDGNNDRFWVSAKGVNTVKNFMIYNRWGQLMFEAHNIPPNDPSYGWDGTYKGYVLEPDVFVVIVDVLCELGSPFHYQTDVSIVR